MISKGTATGLSGSLLLWAALLLFGQTVAAAHQHADEGPAVPCVACHLAKDQTAACDDASTESLRPAVHPAPHERLAGATVPATHLCYRSRAPPRG